MTHHVACLPCCCRELCGRFSKMAPFCSSNRRPLGSSHLIFVCTQNKCKKPSVCLKTAFSPKRWKYEDSILNASHILLRTERRGKIVECDQAAQYCRSRGPRASRPPACAAAYERLLLRAALRRALVGHGAVREPVGRALSALAARLRHAQGRALRFRRCVAAVAIGGLSFFLSLRPLLCATRDTES